MVLFFQSRPKRIHAPRVTFTTPTIPLYQIPVYIKSNSVYVTGQVYPGNSKRWITNYDATKNVVINAFPGAVGETDTFTYVDYLDSDAKKPISVTNYTGSIIHVKSPAMTVAGTVMVQMGAAPTSVTLNSVTLTSSAYTYTAATQSLVVPFAASQAIDLSINGVVHTIAAYEKTSVLGHLQVRAAYGKIELLVPPVTGLRDKSRIEAGILDMSGRQVWKAHLQQIKFALQRMLFG